ncbi:MAG: acetolactate synthase large subunit [Deltaproteobacteria bacterium]|nr:acetolactate synthase large subunit [Deltaproteobacteria bacterium]
MNGAESLVTSLVNAGVNICFTNPGTSEMHFVAALDKVDGMRAVLGLFEGVVTGAADGYGRMTGEPAATLLHLGPGLGNGLANLHNAKKARSPIINIIGEHATYHRKYNAPLQSDIQSIAAPVSDWVKTCDDPKQITKHGIEAVHAALTPPGQVATLILPADVSWSDGAGIPEKFVDLPEAPIVSPKRVAEIAKALQKGDPSAILMDGASLSEEGLALGNRIANHTGAKLYCDTFSRRLARGAGRAKISRLPYFGESIMDKLKDIKQFILVGAKPPVSFFAYPDKPSWLVPDGCTIHTLAEPSQNSIQALKDLAAAVNAPEDSLAVYEQERPELPTGKLDITTAAQAVGALMPENAIISDESNTSGLMFLPMTKGAPKHDWMFLTGGSIGQGLPLSVGASIACPDRKVICLEADGSAMYTIQALWTMARENLDVTTIIFSNRSYAILQVEFARVGVKDLGKNANSVMSLNSPDIDFVNLATGMGVKATRSETADEFVEQLSDAMSEKGPRLIEVVL